MYLTTVSRRRRFATAALWVLTIWSGTSFGAAGAVAWSGGPSWEHLLALLSGVALYADPWHRIWPRRRVMVADLPRLRRELPTGAPDALPNAVSEAVRRG